MKAIPERLQWRLIAAGYLFVILTGGYLAVARYLYEVQHPEDVMASSGMWAGGDAMLFTFIFFMVMTPTLFALRLFARSETLYTTYAKVTLAVTITAPLCLALLGLLNLPSEGFVTDTLLWRILFAPFVIVAVVTSRLVARSVLAKRLLTWAVLTETFTLVLGVALLLGGSGRHA